MKKLVSLIAAAAMVSAVSGAAMAADNNPAVYVDGREIFFDDQAAVIKDDRTLVPARGVFEAMGATVDWDAEARQVKVTNADESAMVRLTIDNAEMKVYDLSGLFAALLSGQDFHAPETVVTLDVPAQIMNDRTMVPLRAISEAFGADVDWNGEVYCVDIMSKDAPSTPDNAPALSLSADADTVAEGENVDLYVNLTNMPADVFVSGIAATIYYDKENFEFVSSTLVNGDTEFEGVLGADNAEFADGYLKTGYITIDKDAAVKEDGNILKVTFKSINGKDGVFFLSNGFQTRLGYNTSLYLDSTTENDNTTNYKGNKLAIDTTPVFVNLEAAE